MAGYSGTPLSRKLGIKPHAKVVLVHVPAEVREELREALAECEIAEARVPVDFAISCAKSQKEVAASLSSFVGRLAPAGMLWIAWPKKSSGVISDLDENKVRDAGLAAGLVDVKVCAINHIWSGLKFVMRLKDRPAVAYRQKSAFSARKKRVPKRT